MVLTLRVTASFVICKQDLNPMLFTEENWMTGSWMLAVGNRPSFAHFLMGNTVPS